MGRRFAFATTSCALALSLTATADAVDVKKGRAELRKMCDATLAMAYKSKPDLKAHVAKSAGYGCFANFGVTVIFGGAGGRGIVHDNATKKDTYMNMGQASAGVELGIKEYREVLVFRNRATLEQFITSGWEVTAAGGATAQAQGKGFEFGQAASGTAGIEIYPMTQIGVAAGGSAAGRKYWRDKELN